MLRCARGHAGPLLIPRKRAPRRLVEDAVERAGEGLVGHGGDGGAGVALEAPEADGAGAEELHGLIAEEQSRCVLIADLMTWIVRLG